jgi:hypothetical protein
MTTTDWFVIAGAVVLIAAVNWWFFVAGNGAVKRGPRDGDGGAS